MTVTAVDFANQAIKGGYVGIPYEKLDCQAFVEKVLKDCGIKKNWKGSNDMWRNALLWKGSRADYKEAFGHDITPGMWVFGWRDDGGEKKRGYNDNQGNAYHVGIYIGGGQVMHSTTGGVQISEMDDKRFNRVALALDLSYGISLDKNLDRIFAYIAEIKNIIGRMEEFLNEF